MNHQYQHHSTGEAHFTSRLARALDKLEDLATQATRNAPNAAQVVHSLGGPEGVRAALLRHGARTVHRPASDLDLILRNGPVIRVAELATKYKISEVRAACQAGVRRGRLRPVETDVFELV